eukprot:9484898-Pyramimonas_sp.AAC.1
MAGVSASGELDPISSAEFSRKTSSRESGKTDFLQDVAQRLRDQGEDPIRSKALRAAKTIQKQVGEARGRAKPSTATAPVANVVPDGHFGPYGNFAPKTPRAEDDEDEAHGRGGDASSLNTPAVESASVELEVQPQGRKRDA